MGNLTLNFKNITIFLHMLHLNSSPNTGKMPPFELFLFLIQTNFYFSMYITLHDGKQSATKLY